MAGTVRGPIEFGKGVEHDRIDFRVFRSDQGSDKWVEIKSSVPGLQLSVDRVIPDTIQTELKPSTSAFGGHTWKLTVVIPPDSQAGVLPPDTRHLPENQRDTAAADTHPDRRERLQLSLRQFGVVKIARVCDRIDWPRAVFGIPEVRHDVAGRS